MENNLDLTTSIVPHLLLIQLKTGMRAGEVAGLTWDCVLWQSSEIKTYRRYDTIKKRWTKPKTEDSVRTVPIDEDTLTILKKIKQEQSVFIENGMITNKENMIFIDLNYNVVTNAGVNKHLKQILKIYLDIDFTKVDLDELTSKRILLTKEVEYLSLSYFENLLLK